MTARPSGSSHRPACDDQPVIWVLLTVVAVLLVGVFAAMLAGWMRYDPMTDPVTSQPDAGLDDGFTATDVAARPLRHRPARLPDGPGGRRPRPAPGAAGRAGARAGHPARCSRSTGRPPRGGRARSRGAPGRRRRLPVRRPRADGLAGLRPGGATARAPSDHGSVRPRPHLPRTPPTSVWEVLTDFAAYGAWIPLTTMRVDPGEPRVGWGFAGLSGLGPLRFSDSMVLTRWEPPTAGRRPATSRSSRQGGSSTAGPRSRSALRRVAAR